MSAERFLLKPFYTFGGELVIRVYGTIKDLLEYSSRSLTYKIK